MGGGGRRHDEILGASVVLTGWSPGREAEVSEALGRISTAPVDLDHVALPLVALAKTSVEDAERTRELLAAAGGHVEVRDAWIVRESSPRAAERPDRPDCPFCGSDRTQRYTHAGPGARKTMKCTSCGRTFRITGRA